MGSSQSVECGLFNVRYAPHSGAKADITLGPTRANCEPTRGSCLRNTYFLLALSLLPTIAGAWIGVATGFSFFAGNPVMGIVVFIKDGVYHEKVRVSAP